MNLFKRLFGKKSAKHPTEQDEETKTDGKEPDATKEKKPRRKYHVSLNRDEKSKNYMMWRVRLEHSDKTIKHFKTQKEAIDYAEHLADDSDAAVVIHKKDGTIRRQNYKKHS